MNEKRFIAWFGFVGFCLSVGTLSADLAKGDSVVHSAVNIAIALGLLALAPRL